METEIEKLESAAPRTFIVSIASKPGLSHSTHQVLVVKATSMDRAKKEAINRIAVGKLARRNNPVYWNFLSIEEANGPSPEPSNG